MNQPPASPAPYREVPDQQILDAARQYHAGYRQLDRQPPGSGVLLPALSSAAIAVELFLKSFAAYQVEMPENDGTGVVIVYPSLPRRSHKLVDWFWDTPTEFQTIFTEECLNRPHLARHGGPEGALEALEGLFQAARYPYERDQDITRYRLQTISECLAGMEESARRLGTLFFRPDSKVATR